MNRKSTSHLLRKHFSLMIKELKNIPVKELIQISRELLKSRTVNVEKIKDYIDMYVKLLYI